MSKITVLNQQEVNNVNGGSTGQWAGAAAGSFVAVLLTKAVPAGERWFTKFPLIFVHSAVVFSSVWVGGLVGAVVEKLELVQTISSEIKRLKGSN